MSDSSSLKGCVRIDVCLAQRQELYGVLVGPDGVSHRFTGWMQLVSALEEQRVRWPGRRSARDE